MIEQMTRPDAKSPDARRLPLPVPRNAQGTLPLSSLQEQLWFLDRLAPGMRAYNVSRTFRVTGPVDVAALERAFADVVRRHEILRTVFTVDEAGPLQKVLPQGQAQLAVDDLRDLPEAGREAEAVRRAEATIRAPYDLERGPLVRLQLLRLGEEDHFLVLGLHHTCADGWSRPIFWRDLAAFYNAHVTGRPAGLPELPLQFGDFAAWQRRLIESAEFQPHLEYWIERLRGLQPLELPTDRPRPTTPSFESDSVEAVLEPEVLDGLRALAERANATPLMVLLAVFEATLARHTSQSEIVIGTATTGRPMQELAPLIGPFINMLVLRTDVSGDPTFADLLERTKRITVEAWQHRSVPFEQVVSAVQPERDPSRNPLYQVALQLLDASTSDAVGPPPLEGLRLEGVDVDVKGHPLDLSLTAVAAEHGLVLHVDYATDLYDRERIARLVAHLERVIRAVVADDRLRVSELPVHSEEELRLLMEEWGMGYEAEQSREPLHVQVAERAAEHPDAVAGRLSGAEITYGELDRRAGLLARRLRELGVGREDIVAVALDRGPELLVALIGVLKAGGAFVMLDPTHPHRRLRFILDDTQARVLLTSSALAARLPEPDGWEQLRLDVESDWLPADPDAPLEELADERSLAYVLYTSGSTGQPKGVLVEHHALTTFILFIGAENRVGPGDRFAQHMALIFDFAIGEIFAALTRGATLVFVPEAERADPAAIGELLERERITYIGGPPAVLGLVEVGDLPDLRFMIAGGEALPGEVVNRWQREGRRFLNGYGPTEAAVGCVRYDCSHRVWKGQPPIGRPMPCRYAYILDRFGQLCPIGVPGELVIGGIDGTGLARGYLNQPELTAERFLDDPFRPGGRYYRTGDLALWSKEGQIEFLGRIDAQVKLNGLRIELEEIESVLQTHPDVAAAAVSVQGETSKQLVGYVVSANGELDPTELRSFLGEELPHYMIPSRFVQLEQLPLTPVGKIDRPALPQAEPDEAEEVEHVPPSTLTEKLVAAIFETILGRERVGAQDHFFTLGGTSLQAARAVLQLREQLGAEIAVRDFYASPRVADVAQTIERARAAEREEGAQADEDVIPKRPDRSRAPLSCTQEQLWFLDQLTPGRATYNIPLVLRLRGALDAEALDTAVAALAVRHEAFRTGFAVEDGRPVQVIEEPSADVRLAPEDWSDLAPDVREERLQTWLLEEAKRPFDLMRDRMFRGRLLRLAPDEHVLALTFHHMCFDGWSAGIVAGELRRFYALAVAGEPLPTEEPAVQYADFAAWQQEQLSEGVLERQVEYWAERLRGAEPLELPSDRPRPEVPTNRGARLVYTVPVEVLEDLRGLAQRHGVTLYAALLAATKAVLCRWSGQEDVVIGTAVPGRRAAQLEQLVGCLINMVVLRTDLSGDPTFAELIARAMATVSGAWDNDQAPFEKVVERLGRPRDASRNPLFLFGIDLQSEDVRDFGLPGLETEVVPIDPGTSRFDVAINTYEGPSGLTFRVEYSTDLFDAARIERLLQQIERVIRAVVDDDGLRLSELPLLSEEERELVLEGWGRGAEADQPQVPVHVQIAERAAAQPGAVAARSEGRELTYGELEERAGLLARRLHEAGVGHQDRVAVALERGPDLLVGLVAVLKAGAAFVMLDPAQPLRRSTYILTDTEARAVLTSTAFAASLPEPGAWQQLHADVEGEWRPAEPDAPLEALADERSLAYVLYTSGSTGQPKGVLVEHHALTTFLLWWRTELGFSADDRFAQHMALHFDFAVGEIFGALVSGATLVFMPEADRTDPARFSQFLARERPTYLGGPPAVLGTVEVPDLPELRVLVAGGEALPGEVVNRWQRDGRRFVNGYGPTETTIGCTFFDCAGRTWRRQPPIGRPMPRRYAYVLDHLGQPCAIGVPGELVIGGIDGAGLARGYLNQPELTEQKFVEDPLRPGGRFYRTGDLVVWSEEGQLEFLGRIDAQVKLNGLRIELEEIESVLQLHPDVAAAAVSVQGEATKQLVGFVVSSNGELDPDALRAFLGEELPHYMIPTRFVQLERLPLTAVGKIDRAALPQAGEEDGAAEVEFVAPSTPTEQQVAAIFGEILGREEIGIYDNFFTAGGTSLQAARAVLRLRQELGVEVAVRDFYAAPRIADVARIVDQARGGPEDGAAELDARRREIEELRKRLAEAEAELEREEAGPAAPPAPPAEIVIERRADPSRAPLAFTQEQLWFLDQLSPGRATYNIPVVMRLRGALDEAAVERAIAALVERHEPMRTRLAVEDGQPLQVIEAPAGFELPVEDWSARPEAEREQALQAWLAEEAERPFDLARDLMFRSRLLRLAPEDHVLALTFHHSCFDGGSAGIVADELRQLYDLAVAGKALELPEPPLQFGDYAAWQQEQLASGELERHVAYWEQKLKGAPELELPSDRPRPEVASNRGSRLSHAVPVEVLEEFRELARRRGVTLFAALLAAVKVVLVRWSGQEDVVIGTTSRGRRLPQLERLVGCLINMVVLRTDLYGDPTFAELLGRTMTTLSESWDHETAPFEKVVERLGVPKDTSRNPIFQFGVDLQDESVRGFELTGCEVEFLPINPDTSRFDVAINTYEGPSGLVFRCEYATDLFDRRRIERFFRQVELVIRAAIADDGLRVSELPLLDEAERRRMMDEWGRGRDAEQPRTPVHVQIAERAAAHPDAVAARLEEVELTFGELDRRAGLLARRLRELGVGREEIVGVALERGPDLLVACLGVLKAGGAVVMLDAGHPHRRLRFLLEDTRAKTVLTTSALAARLPEPEGWVRLCADVEGDWLPAHPDAPLEELADEDSLAYVLYTSGSTGQPKGVLVEHHALTTFISWMGGEFGFGPGDRFAQHMSLIFDFAIGELFTAMTSGAALVAVPEADRIDYAAFGKFLERERITFIGGPPAVLGSIEVGELPHLRVLIAGGEGLPGEVVNRWQREGRRFVNGYGPAEAVIGCVFFDCAGRTWRGQPPVGRPMPRRYVYILDRYGQLCPVGVPGELVVGGLGGAGLARGYLNQPELTAERFLDDPFRPGGRFYRTGDLAVWSEEGQVEFLGRMDTQVKVDGRRIELEEIESVLRGHPDVTAAAVTVQGETAKQLVGYVVSADGGLDPAALRSFLSEELPHYMIPSRFVQLEKLPLTRVGKIDRAALVAAEEEAAVEEQPEYVEPATETERRVAAVFAEVLERDGVGAQDSFFALGGSSLQAAKAVLRLRQVLGVEFPLRLLYAHPTVAAFAAAVEAPAPREDGDGLPAAGVALGGLPPRPAQRFREVLLTGVTGFFGAFLLEQLLEQGEARVHCLVRAASDADAWERLRASLRSRGIERDDLAEWVSVVRGDLGQPRLGLAEDVYARLAADVDAIVHSGAHVDLLFPYAELEGVNVGGTRAVVELAATGVLKEIHFVSTVSARRGADFDPSVYGYAISKWQAERVLVAARGKGVPVAIYRLPRLAGDTRTGRGNDRDVVGRLVRRFAEMGVAPELELEEEWVPVDEAARVLVQTATASPDGGLFTIMPPSRVRIRTLIDLVSESGVDVALKPPAEFMEEIVARFPEDREVMSTILAPPVPIRESGLESGHPGAVFVDVEAPGVDETLLRRYAEVLGDSVEAHAPSG